jgi:hypothetical protein
VARSWVNTIRRFSAAQINTSASSAPLNPAILKTDEIELWPAQQQPTNDVPAEILVAWQTKHDWGSIATLTEQPPSHHRQVGLAGFNSATDLVRQTLAAAHVCLDIGPIPCLSS